MKKVIYRKCSKISNTVFFLFSNKKLVIRAGTGKRLVRIANRENPDQTASSEAVCHVCLGFCGRQILLKILEHLP